MLNRLLVAFWDALMPARCLLCDEIIAPNRHFCRFCSQRIKKPAVERCLGCGNAVKKCTCKDYIYLFDGITSPFFNEGAAKSAYYKYKFSQVAHSSDYFGQMMAESVRTSFGDIRFDCITAVPSSSKDPEFDHTKLLAHSLSKCLNIQFDDLLCSTEKQRRHQRELTLKDRFVNVDGAYKVIKECKGKNILLLDDIKTTGATINECARMLKFAGAKSVYCVSVLIGNKQNER